MIEEISCCGYRGFATNQTLKLAIPNGGRGSNTKLTKHENIYPN